MNILINPQFLEHLMALEHPELAKEASSRVMELRRKIAVHVLNAKAAIDELTHSDISSSIDPVTMELKEKYRWFRDHYGPESIIYNTVLKMIVTFERPRGAIIREIKERGELPAAFNKNLIASSRLGDHYVCLFAEEATQRALETNNHKNTDRLLNLLRKRYKHYMSKLKKKLYRLSNGSNTRIEDGVNIQDINGMIYVTEEEYCKIREEWSALVSFLKIANFDDNFQYIEAKLENGTFGSINYAPDDSGKTRISYCIDPAVQVISRAVHKLIDYLVRDLACNGTYRQMCLIKNMIKKGYHKTELCISTDMSKYSDTLQFKYIREILKAVGLPEDVLDSMEDLYTLPMRDSVLNETTPRTTASYQGQYGDFPLITLLNIWNQSIVYDYINYVAGSNYKIEYCMKKNHSGEYYSDNSTNSAVGDDTMMVFVNCPMRASDVYEIIRAVFNRCGVNINKTKTHILDHGVGSCDFVKRIITANGLVPYLRMEGICGSFDDKCAELLRFYRDNILTDEEFKRYCVYFLGDYRGELLYNLHPINGGVIDREVDDDDLLRFIRRHESLNLRYQNRRDDELRKWFKNMRSEGIHVSETALIAFVEDEPFSEERSYVDEDTDEDNEELVFDCELCNCDIIEPEEEIVEITDEDVEAKILQLHVCGFRYFELKNLGALLGKTMKWLRRNREDLSRFLDDYQRAEAYRYMTSRVDHLKLTTYSDMFSNDYLPLVSTSSIERMKFTDDKSINISDGKVDYINKLIRRRNENDWFSLLVHGHEYFYLDIKGVSPHTVRLYPAANSKYPILTYLEFCSCLHIVIPKDDSWLKQQYLCYQIAMEI